MQFMAHNPEIFIPLLLLATAAGVFDLCLLMMVLRAVRRWLRDRPKRAKDASR